MDKETAQQIEKLLEANVEASKAITALAETQYILAQALVPQTVLVELPPSGGMTMQ